MSRIAVRKVSVHIPMTNETAIALGLMEPPPLTDAERRIRRRGRRRRWIAINIPRPLLWIESASGWLYVEAANLLFRAARVNERMAHERPEEGDW